MVTRDVKVVLLKYLTEFGDEIVRGSGCKIVKVSVIEFVLKLRF